MIKVNHELDLLPMVVGSKGSKTKPVIDTSLSKQWFYWLTSALLCIVHGVNFAAICFNIMHDAGPGSFSDHKKLNSVLSFSLNLLGGNIYLCVEAET